MNRNEKIKTIECNKTYKPKYFERLLKTEQWAKNHYNGMWLEEWME